MTVREQREQVSAVKPEAPDAARLGEAQAATSAAAALIRGRGGALRPESVLALQRTVGNRAVVQMLGAERSAPVQAKADPIATARAGTSGAGGPLPHLTAVQRAFGRHDVGSIRAHTDGAATASARAMDAMAYTVGDHVAFAGAPDLFTTAHEAAHAVQQRAGVDLPGGVGVTGDRHERHADAVAARVTAGQSAEDLLDRYQGAPGGGSRPGAQLMVQRRDMRAVMIEQRAREMLTDANSKSKKPERGSYTTVGFEWDIAHTAPHSEATPNVLQGLTHVELAKSDLQWNGLPYILETDAQNTLELVTPPFYVRTQEKSTLPNPADLQDIVDSMREGLDAVVKDGDTIGALMEKKEWERFAIKGWNPEHMEISWRNWSPRAQSKDDIAAELHSWPEVTIKRTAITHKNVKEQTQPQVNIALSGTDYGEALGSGESRLGSKDPFVKLFEETSKKLENFVAQPARKKLDAESDAGRRINLVFDHLVRVLAQQLVVPVMGKLAGHQQRGYDHGDDVANAMRQVSGPPSYIKDQTAVWLKTDLFTFAAGLLQADDWTLLGGDRGLLAEMSKALLKRKIGEEVPYELMDGVLQALRGHADEIVKKSSSGSADEKRTARQKYIVEQFQQIAKLKPDFNEHEAKILGVRQDTFISPTVMARLSQRLNLGGMLSVVEVRNTSEFLEWLATGKKGSSGSSGSSGVDLPDADAPVVNQINDGQIYHANETAGDGNCFFHALYEAQNDAWSTPELQQAVRQSVIDAIGLKPAIATSHFGGINSPEYNYFADQLLQNGEWVADHGPAVVADALNLRIKIYNLDGTLRYDSVPNPIFGHVAAPTVVHLQYTGAHYNSFTNPALDVE